MKRSKFRHQAFRKAQRGAVTMFSAVLILILLTEVIIYATQVGVFEQRKSSNEMRQKMAFHVADSAIQQAKQFLSVNSTLAASYIVDQRADGTDGWLAAGSTERRWEPCNDGTPAYSEDDKTHPCWAEPVQELRDNSYFYSFTDVLTDEDWHLPLDPDSFGSVATTRVTMHALLCMLDIDRSDPDRIVQGCTQTEPADWDYPTTGEQDRRYFMVTLLARGEADCEDNDNDGEADANTCKAEALIAEKIGSFGPGAGDGGPGAPLTARTNVPLSGTVEIVANPNGGGNGVPLSSWVNDNPAGSACYLGGDAISPISGSYATCQRHEWYGVDIMPGDFKCPSVTCSCDPNKERMLTYAQGAERQMGPDILYDDDFPCDLWGEMFGLTADELKDSMPKSRVLSDCSTLDDSSDGMYWISGSECDIKQQIGGRYNPVTLISAASNTKVSAGGSLFGVLMVTDQEDPGAEFTGNGHATIYGAAIMDAAMDNFNGTFQIVYVDALVGQAFETPLFGAVAGGWTDFHADWQ